MRVWYAWQGLPLPGQIEEFTTLLLPHEPVRDVAPWVERSVQLVLNQPGRTVFRIRRDAGSDRHEFILMNRAGDPLHVEGLETDASTLYLSAGSATADCVFATEATYVKWQGETVAESDAPQLIEYAHDH